MNLQLNMHRIDHWMIMTVTILVLFGLVMVYSASSFISVEKSKDPGYYFKRQVVRVVISVFIFLFFLFIRIKWLERYARQILILAVGLLFITLLPKILHGGPPARWLNLGPFRFQTAELARFALILFFSSYFSRNKELIGNFRDGFLVPMGIILLISVLIIAQPDLSTAVIIAMVGISLMIVAGVSWRYIMIGFLITLLCAGIAILLEPYRLERVLILLNPDKVSASAAHQIRQSLISLGNGGVLGLGLGASLEKNLFLPAPHTDFIFAIVGEEFGFIGSFIVISLFLFLFLRGIRIIKASTTPFEWLLGFGLLISVVFYVLINVLVVTGICPITGVPLPFFSFGGSAMMYNAAVFGILANLSRNRI